MSRLPNVSYDYSEADYYYQDSSGLYQEGYVGQVVFNPYEDGAASGNFTEIYRRPATVAAAQKMPANHDDGRYCRPNYDYSEYYYDNQQPVYDPKSGQYYVMPPPEPHHYHRLSPQIQSRLYNEDPVQLATQKQPIKRYPITVKTPRFYKRANSLYKQPSALCLPVISQPDPATSVRRHKKTHHHHHHQERPTVIYHQEHVPQSKKHYHIHEETPSNHKMDSEGDLNLNNKLTHLERLLARYEQESRMDPLQVNSRSDIAKLAKTLKPRIPSTVKLRQDRQKLKAFQNFDIQEIPRTVLTTTSEAVKVSSDGVKIAPDALDQLLLKLKKCEIGGEKQPLGGDHKERKPTKEFVETKPTEDDEPEPPSPPPLKSKSYNYQDISDQFKKSQNSNLRTTSSSISNESARSDLDDPSSSSSPVKCSKASALDDNCALELHRSKSYIVNLIDRALSKELGTVPCDRYQKTKFETMSTKKAIEMVNRHSSVRQEDSDPTLQQSNPNAIVAGCNGVLQPTSCSSKTCDYKEETSYIKQLKQLRWGHLKHIQSEVRRLEDLERFLDACTEGNEESEL